MNVGDYCYIKGISRDYGIGKITQLNSGYSSNGGELIDIQFKHSKHSVPKKDVVSSDSPIDLIEVGDYVNGSKVLAINCNFEYIDDDSDYGVDEVDNGLRLENGIIYFGSEIENIVTKEQFESMKYEVIRC